jgi:hypothetical protein
LQATTSAGGLVGPLGASAMAAATSLRIPFFITGTILLLAALWVWRAVPNTLHAEPIGDPVEPAPATGSAVRSS